jgi:hypothetical protein
VILERVSTLARIFCRLLGRSELARELTLMPISIANKLAPTGGCGVSGISCIKLVVLKDRTNDWYS